MVTQSTIGFPQGYMCSKNGEPPTRVANELHVLEPTNSNHNFKHVSNLPESATRDVNSSVNATTTNPCFDSTNAELLNNSAHDCKLEIIDVKEEVQEFDPVVNCSVDSCSNLVAAASITKEHENNVDVKIKTELDLLQEGADCHHFPSIHATSEHLSSPSELFSKTVSDGYQDCDGESTDTASETGEEENTYYATPLVSAYKTENSVNINFIHPNDAEQPPIYPLADVFKVEDDQTTRDCKWDSTLSASKVNRNVLYRQRLVTNEDNFNFGSIRKAAESLNLAKSPDVIIKEEDVIAEEGSCSDHGTSKESISSTLLNNLEKEVTSLITESLINGLALYSCPHCEFRTDKAKIFDLHLPLHITNEEKDFRCPVCQFRTKYNQRLSTHMRLHNLTKKNLFVCSICSYQTYVAETFSSHLLLHYNDGSKVLKCPLCDFKTSVKSDIKKHFLLHYPNPQKRYACDKCKFSTVDRYYFMRHLHIHDTNRIKEFACDQCPYRTNAKSSLAIHISNHDANRAKQQCCLHSDFKTYDKSNLRQHVFCHGKDQLKPHACPHCNYRTDYKHALTVHLCKHNDQYVSGKSYVCTVCSYQTENKSHFQRHLRKHDKNCSKPFKCHLCHYATDDNDYLVHCHMQRHDRNKSKNLYCLECDFRTDCNLSLERHVEKNHRPIINFEVKFPWMFCNDDRHTPETKSKQSPRTDSQHTPETDSKHTPETDSKHRPEIDSKHRSESDSSLAHETDRMHTPEMDCEYSPKTDVILSHETILDKKFCCLHCDYTTVGKFKMERHFNTHKSIEKQLFHCHFCEFTTLDRRGFVAHTRLHSNKSIQSFSCEQCDYKTAHGASLTKHVLTHATDDFSCSLCLYSTNDEPRFVKHLAAHKNMWEVTGWQECKLKYETAAPPECKDKYDKVPLLRYRRNQDKIARKCFKDKIPWFGCEACNYTTSYRPFIIKHLRCHSCSKRGNNYECPVCLFKAPLQGSILLHMARRHIRQNKPATTSRPRKADSYVEISVEVVEDVVRTDLSDAGSIPSDDSVDSLVVDSVAGNVIYDNYGNNAAQKSVRTNNNKSCNGTVRINYGNAIVDQTASSVAGSVVIDHDNKEPVFFYSCNKCSYKAERLAVFARHMNKHETPEKSFVCIDCDFQTDKKHDLALHTRLHMTGRRKKPRRKRVSN